MADDKFQFLQDPLAILPFRELLNETSLQVYIADVDGKLLWVNSSACDILGYSQEQLLTMHIYDIDSQVTTTNWSDVVRKIRTDRRSVIQSEHVNKDGDVIYVEVTICLISSDNKEYICGFSQDISDSVRLEQNIFYISETYSAAINTTQMGFWTVSTEGEILETNSAYENMTGFSRNEIIGKHIWDFDADETSEVTLARSKRITEIGASIFRSRHYRKGGSSFPVEVETSFNAIGDGVFFAFIKDISREIEQQENERRAQRTIKNTLKKTVYALASTLEKRDPYTAGHEENVARISKMIAQELGFDDHFIEGLELGAIIHDIGKIQVPAEILNKPTRLTDIEYQLIQEHAAAGGDIVQGIEFDWPIDKMISQHHERIDGSGYPLGLKGDEIITEAKIIAVADTLDAMATHRPYRAGLGIEIALNELKKNAGKLYDADIVHACETLVLRGDIKIS